MTKTSLRPLLGALLLAAAVHAHADNDHGRARASFALLGDVPYGMSEEPKFDRVVAAINAAPAVRFVVHTGDVKQGSERCDDAVFQKRFAQYQRFERAFVVTPGDNTGPIATGPTTAATCRPNGWRVFARSSIRSPA